MGHSSTFRIVFAFLHTCYHSIRCFVLFPGVPQGLLGGLPGPTESFLRKFVKFLRKLDIRKFPGFLESP